MRVSIFSMLVFIFFLLTFQLSQCATIVVDGVSEWKYPAVQIGDSVVFQRKNHFNLYIFQNQEAFNSCNFTQATLLTKPNSTSYIWHPSRPGFFYFSFNNGTNKACQEGQKLAVKVSVTPAPENQSSSPPSGQPQLPAGAAPPISYGGGSVSSSPTHPWPFRPREGGAISPSHAPSGFPFINSNPAVPLPTGEVDSATIRPVPTSGDQERQMVGFLALQRALCWVVFSMLL